MPSYWKLLTIFYKGSGGAWADYISELSTVGPIRGYCYFCSIGITKYNLFGHFSSIAILGNFWLLLGYNVTFITLTTLILFTQATQSIVKEVTLLFRSRVASLRIFKSSLALSSKISKKLHSN